MNKIRCIIVDDEPTAREIMQLLVNQIDDLEIVLVCKNASEVIEVLNKESIDILFLDINMPDMSGITLAKSISINTKIIFTTAYREYAIDGFDLQAVDYLLKPISLERLKKAVDKYKKENRKAQVNSNETKEYLIVRSERKMVKINFSEILFIESLSDYLKVHTTSKTIITRETISTIEAKLPVNTFIRVHRSYIISIPFINSFTSEHVNVQNKSIPISRKYRMEFLGKMNS
ncbi:MAG: LytTR family DNA-binding domain-containing protein [Flavobacteriaceae bacterium]